MAESLSEMVNWEADMPQRQIARARRTEQVTPAGWDRDCRVCMTRSLMVSTELFGRRQIKGAGIAVIVVAGEEVHAWHSNDELAAFLADEAKREGRA